jgi:hypothetical protein
MTWDIYNKRQAELKATQNPSPIFMRVYTILDKLDVTYTKTGEFSDAYGARYFPIAILTNGAVIDARGRHDGGWEDKKQRISADKKQICMYAQNIPFLMGRNDWDALAWEVNIKYFLTELKNGNCPQVIGRRTPRLNSTDQKRKINFYE